MGREWDPARQGRFGKIDEEFGQVFVRNYSAQKFEANKEVLGSCQKIVLISAQGFEFCGFWFTLNLDELMLKIYTRTKSGRPLKQKIVTVSNH